MKKIYRIILLMIIIFFIMTVNVLAGSFKLKTDVTKQNDEYLLKLSLGENIDGNGIMVMAFDLEYDKEIFEEVEKTDITLLKNWTDLTYNPETGTVVIIQTSFSKEKGEEILEIKLHQKMNSEKTKTEVLLKEIQASDGEKTLEMEDQIIQIKISDNNYMLKILLISIVIALVLLLILKVLKNKRRKKSNGKK